MSFQHLYQPSEKPTIKVHPAFIRIDCDDPMPILGIDVNKHEKVILVRCRKYDTCLGCFKHRKSVILAKLLQRWKLLQPKPRRVYLWTFGTSMKEGSTNRSVLTKYWQRFRKILWIESRRKNFSWKPLFWVAESGTRGNRLHIHAIIEGFFSQKRALRIWRKITNEKSNVNYAKDVPYKPLKSFYYVAKYLAKEGARYYWMGRLFKVGQTYYETPKCEICGEKYTVWMLGVFYSEYFQYNLYDYAKSA